MDMTGAILFTMLPAMALIMLNLGIGPFGHPRFLHHHIRYRVLPAALRNSLQALCVLVLITGAAQLLGIIDLTPSSSNQQ